MGKDSQTDNMQSLEAVSGTARLASSVDYLRDYRFNFWNIDFLRLMAERWGLSTAESLLEVGCGRGHWMACLIPHLREGVILWCVDREEYAVRSTRELIRQLFPHFRHNDLQIIRANGNCLPFLENSFDVV